MNHSCVCGEGAARLTSHGDEIAPISLQCTIMYSCCWPAWVGTGMHVLSAVITTSFIMGSPVHSNASLCHTLTFMPMPARNVAPGVTAEVGIGTMGESQETFMAFGTPGICAHEPRGERADVTRQSRFARTLSPGTHCELPVPEKLLMGSAEQSPVLYVWQARAGRDEPRV